MEASEKPQLPLDATTEGNVRALEDRLVIERLEVIDELAAHVVRDQAAQKRPPAETVRKAIEIGTRIIDSESVATNVDMVKRELQGGLGELSKELSQTLETGGRELEEKITESFGSDRSDSVQQQIKAIVQESIEQQRSDLMKILTAEDGSNPLVAIQVRMGKAIMEAEERHRVEIAGLRENLARMLEKEEGDQRVAEAEEAGTRKGRSFEERVADALGRIAASRGDAALHVGDEPGVGGSKKGDVVVQIDAAEGTATGTVVFEVKDSRLSRPRAWEELNGALEARAASFAVLVVAGEANLPAEREQLHEYEGNKLIVAVDPEDPDDNCLDVAYRFARLRVLLARESDLTVDAPGVRDAASEARAALEALKSIKSSLSKATNNVDHAKGAVELMVATVIDRLSHIETLITAAEADAAADD